MVRFLIFLLIFSIKSTQTSAQLTDNEYYELIDSCLNRSRVIVPIGKERFLGLPLKGFGYVSEISGEHLGPVYLLDENRKKIELPYDQIKWNAHGYKCVKDGKIAVFSIESFQAISPYYESLRQINPNFYMTWQNDSLLIFNSKNKMIFKAVSEMTERQSKRLIRGSDGNEEQIVCNINGEEFYLNSKGEKSKYDISKNEPPYPDGTYKFIKDQKWGIKNKDSSILIEPIYQYVDFLDDGKYLVTKRGDQNEKTLCGVINEKAEFLLPLTKVTANVNQFGLTIKKGKKLRFLDHNLKNKYDKEFDKLKVYKCGLIHGEIDEEDFYDLIFTKKNEIKKGGIENANEISEDYCAVRYKNGLFVIYDKFGETVFRSKGKATSATKIQENVFQIRYGMKKFGLINSSGEWIIKPGSFIYEKGKNKKGIYRYDFEKKQSDLISLKGELIYSNVSRTLKSQPTIHNFIVSNKKGTALVSPLGKLLIPFGDYRIYEYKSISPSYYKLTLDNVSYIVKLK